MGELDIIAALRKLNRDVNIPMLRGLNIPEERYRSLLDKMAADALASGSPANNPRDASAAQIVELYHKAYAETAWA
jgi:alcohol dehydrogenase class IV